MLDAAQRPYNGHGYLAAPLSKQLHIKHCLLSSSFQPIPNKPGSKLQNPSRPREVPPLWETKTQLLFRLKGATLLAFCFSCSLDSEGNGNNTNLPPIMHWCNDVILKIHLNCSTWPWLESFDNVVELIYWRPSLISHKQVTLCSTSEVSKYVLDMCK